MLEATAQEISAATGNAVLPLQCDVRDPAAIKAAVDLCVEKFGLPDVVVHNAAGNFVRTTHLQMCSVCQSRRIGCVIPHCKLQRCITLPILQLF